MDKYELQRQITEMEKSEKPVDYKKMLRLANLRDIYSRGDEYLGLMQELNDKIYEYDYVICACIKDEEDYLDEWVTHHLNIGFEHIYLYDNNSAISVKEFCEKQPWSDKVTVTRWETRIMPQKSAYNDFIQQRPRVKWVAFIDIDEFFDIKTGQTIKELMEQNYSQVAAVHFCWEIYDANGQLHNDGRPVRERFTRKVKSRDWFDGKYICRPDVVKKALVHSVELYEPYLYVDSHYNLKNYERSRQFDICCIAHYFTKSLDEWVRKIRRGSVDKDWLRNYMEFFDYNPDMLEYVDETLIDEKMSYPEAELDAEVEEKPSKSEEDGGI